jgi:hypothetical protein
MASGSKLFSLTANDLIAAALKKIGVYQSGEAAQPEEIEDARIALNLMIKEMSPDLDIPWRRTITLFLSAGTQSYSIGETGGHAAISYDETTLAADVVAGATSLSLASTTGISSGDFIGIRLDDDTIHWTTTNSTGSVIGAALPSAAAAGNAVYTYTTKAPRPQKVLHASRRDDANDTDVTLIGDGDYRGLSSKAAPGPVNQVSYQQTYPNGTLYVWPTGGEKLLLRTQNEMDTFIQLTDAPDCPREWLNMLVWKLAAEIAPEYGAMSAKELITLQTTAERKYQNVLSSDVENASVTFAAERR